MAEETLFESEQVHSRTEIAAALRSLAAQLDDGPVTFEAADRSVTVEPPERAVFEIEVERESDETSIELEIEWPTGDAAEIEPKTAVEGDARTAVATGVETSKSLARFEVFRDRAGEWRWRLVHRNGNVIADGGEGYASKQNALKGLTSVRRNAPGAVVVSK